jgi:glycosyltransferase involved in cell wall biosynthesis
VHYRIPDVLAAFSFVKAAFPEAKLTLVGTGPLASQLRKLSAEMDLRDVFFAGAVRHDQIADWYDTHDVFINASAIDNLPVSLLEAFAAGLPVVSTDAGGIPYLVDHGRTGLLSPVGEPARLAESVMQLLGDPVLASDLASHARKECAKYSCDVVGAQWAKLYRELAGSTLEPGDVGDGRHKRDHELTTR